MSNAKQTIPRGLLAILAKGSLITPKEKPVRPERPCIVCQKPHRGNNAFCSAACCKAHKAAKKAT